MKEFNTFEDIEVLLDKVPLMVKSYVKGDIKKQSPSVFEMGSDGQFCITYLVDSEEFEMIMRVSVVTSYASWLKSRVGGVHRVIVDCLKHDGNSQITEVAKVLRKDVKLLGQFGDKLKADIFYLGCYVLRPSIEKIGERLGMPFREYDSYNSGKHQETLSVCGRYVV